MTTPNHPTGQPSPAWQRHHNTTNAAMHNYLTTTYAAHQQYLTGPWPDRDAYNAVEVSAWMTYHAKCRAAWNTYQAESNCPCCTRGGNDCTCHADCGSPRCQMAEPPAPTAGNPEPCPVDGRTDPHWHHPDTAGTPTFTPKGNE